MLDRTLRARRVPRKTFLLGLGNQKCGTTWLHRYLQLNPCFEAGITKEYHIWDVLDLPIKKNAGVNPDRVAAGVEKAVLRSRMLEDPEYYFAYFDGLFSRQVTLTADITPTYSGLKAERLSFIRNRFSRRGVAVKAVVLLRDPVARIKSAVRFNLDQRNYGEGIERGEDNFLRALEQYYPTEHCLLRTSYHTQLAEVEQVFDAADLHVGVFETMFQPTEIERVSKFCGVAPNPDFAKVAVNRTRTGLERSDELDAEIRAFYRPVYEYCHETFPVTRELWR